MAKTAGGAAGRDETHLHVQNAVVDGGAVALVEVLELLDDAEDDAAGADGLVEALAQHLVLAELELVEVEGQALVVLAHHLGVAALPRALEQLEARQLRVALVGLLDQRRPVLLPVGLELEVLALEDLLPPRARSARRAPSFSAGGRPVAGYFTFWILVLTSLICASHSSRM